MRSRPPISSRVNQSGIQVWNPGLEASSGIPWKFIFFQSEQDSNLWFPLVTILSFFCKEDSSGPGVIPILSKSDLLLQRFFFFFHGVEFYLFIYHRGVVFPPLSGAWEEWADDRVGCPELMTSPVFTSSFTFVLT